MSVLYDTLNSASTEPIPKGKHNQNGFLGEFTKQELLIHNSNNNVKNNNNSLNHTNIKNINNNVLPKPENMNSHSNLCPVVDKTKYIIERRMMAKSNFEADLETFKELGAAILYAIWGILVAVVLTCIPRRFRYKDIHGQVVLVTGAGSGIGRLMAKKLGLVHGATIVAWDINKAGNDETVKEIRACGGKCYGYTVDVSSRASIYEAAAKVKAEVGKVEILINNAGIVSGKKFLDIPDELIEKTFQVNTLSNFWTVKAFLPDMLKENRGHIVTIASTAGLIGVNRLVDYCASKYAAVGFNEAIQSELRAEPGHENINTTVICPYYINTGMFDGIRSKIISILPPDVVVDDIVAGILTNQEQVVIPRYVYLLIVLKMIVPGEVGRRIAAALGITGTMMHFKGRDGAPAAVKNGVKNN